MAVLGYEVTIKVFVDKHAAKKKKGDESGHWLVDVDKPHAARMLVEEALDEGGYFYEFVSVEKVKQ